MKKKFEVLIIDDHPLIVDAYNSALLHTSAVSNLNFEINLANDCDTALQKIGEMTLDNGIDLIFLDISLPPSKANKIFSGEDIGMQVREILPNTKIIISTTFNDNYRLNTIFKSINPEGFLIKNDITPQELVKAIQIVIEDPPYYSKTITKLLRKLASQNLVLDKIDRELLYELSIGTKMKDLPSILPLSIAGLEKRKRQLKELFDIRKKGDRELVIVAKEKGFI